MSDFFRRTWAEIDLDAIAHNFREIKKQLKPETKVCCVIKADAYGHGAELLAREYEELGADWFAVSNLEEAIQLRNAQIGLPILVLGYTPPEMAKELSNMDVAQAILSREYGERLAACAQEAGVTVRAHIKVDTGMSRIGFMFQDPSRDAGAVEEIANVCGLEGLEAEGIFSHFAVADEGNDGCGYTLMQLDLFRKLVDQLALRGVTFPLKHCSNSAAVLDYPDAQLDMVRPGIILYGLNPSGQVKNKIDLRPAMQLKSIISMIKTVEPQTSVSYGRRYTTKKQTVVATVPVGYADGYSRHLYTRASVLIRGKKAKIIGRVCMDQLMVNVTAIKDAKEGDVVTLFGRDGDAVISVDELAAYNHTISYELVCLLSKRVPRVYYRNGEAVAELDYLCSNNQ
ncbi:alanine racemase [Clostridium sp. D33t1_170424_F3]|uniref:alanine racemase n=1 Tax=Clostridium sp. D33t1_170424_F3 TaxID=2787099 RepID=UPI0018A9A9D6|nr:alanine racemase [Clostridium sp. D33t1_170424_F3]